MKEFLKSVYSKVLILTLIAFICGFFWGWAWGTYYTKNKIHKIFSRKPEDRHMLIVERLDRELNFTPDQFKAVDEIVYESLKKIEEIRKRHFPEEDAVFREGLEKIEKVLTEEQKERWIKIKYKLIKDRERFRKHRLESHPPPPPE
ncbi:MAG: hypothetical protein WHS38_01535 [Thermodesulforhabdaceae bacterium]